MLKKCVVIMVLFALVTGAVFAQMTLGGQLMEGMTLFSGNNVKDADVNMGGTYNSTYHEAKISALIGDGTAGGRLVMYAKGGFWGWMQWRPNQFFRVKIGSDGDGEWGFPQIIGWGFTGEAKNSVAAVNDYDGSLPMKYRHAGLNYGGFDGDGSFNLGLSLFPTDLIQVNVLFRDFDKEGEASDKLSKMQLSASIKLEEIGTIRFAAVGSGGLAKHADDGGVAKDRDAIGVLHLAFYSNELVQGFAFEVGGQYDLPHLNQTDLSDQIAIGAGINLTSTDPFNLKFRGGIKLGGTKWDDKKKAVYNNELVGFSVGILPSYKLPKMTIFFHAGMGTELEYTDNDGKTVEGKYEWFINPYVWVPMGGMRMWIGIQIIDQHGTREDGAGQFKWNVPFGFNFYF
jgi:hypothetical protein